MVEAKLYAPKHPRYGIYTPIWYSYTMRVRIDPAGRIVLPKPFRRLVGLEHGGEVEVTLEGTTLRLDPTAVSRREIEVVDGWPVLTVLGSGSISDADVQSLRDEQR